MSCIVLLDYADPETSPVHLHREMWDWWQTTQRKLSELVMCIASSGQFLASQALGRRCGIGGRILHISVACASTAAQLPNCKTATMLLCGVSPLVWHVLGAAPLRAAGQAFQYHRSLLRPPSTRLASHLEVGLGSGLGPNLTPRTFPEGESASRKKHTDRFNAAPVGLPSCIAPFGSSCAGSCGHECA